ncbi:hypothetical protein [Marinibacterium sp. SX1]|uniref:hypothetical protein n=1 Tax=Marinibacterium sp. SX1 TaxID=3388424 RepID=UPI003D17B953
MKLFQIMLVALILAPGCAKVFWDQEDVLFDGIEFRHKSQARDKSDRKAFQVQVRPVSASITAAREAGKYEATSYCITHFGSSDIKWEIGPETEVVPIENDTLTFLGRCNP